MINIYWSINSPEGLVVTVLDGVGLGGAGWLAGGSTSTSLPNWVCPTIPAALVRKKEVASGIPL